MNKFDSQFRDHLINTETTDSQLQNKYRKELQEMLERKIEGWWLWIYVAYASLCLGIALRLLDIAFYVREPLVIPEVVWQIIGFLGLFLLFKTGLIIWIICKGKLDLKKTAIRYSWLAWILAVLISFKLVIHISFSIGIFVLLFCSVIHLNQIIRNNGLKTREKLLEIELRLAELSEKTMKQ